MKRRITVFGLVALVTLAAGILSGFQNQNFGGVGLPAGLLFSAPTFTISGVGSGNGVLALAGNTSGTATFTAPAVAGTVTNPVLSSNTFRVASGTQLEIGPDTGLSREAAGVIDVGNGTQADSSALLSTGNHVFLNAPFTDSNASGLQVITGLSFALGTVAHSWSFHCSLTYSQATPSASDQFGVASLTTSPTNLHAWAHVITTEGAAAVQNSADSGNITNTTPTAIVTFTPVGTGVKAAEIDGSIETAGTTATTLQFYVTNGTAADVIVIARDSYCVIY